MTQIRFYGCNLSLWSGSPGHPTHVDVTLALPARRPQPARHCVLVRGRLKMRGTTSPKMRKRAFSNGLSELAVSQIAIGDREGIRAAALELDIAYQASPAALALELHVVASRRHVGERQALIGGDG